MTRRVADTAQPASENYQGLITRWDLMRVPADQALLLTVFVGTGVALVVLFWAFMPVTTPHPHEDYKKSEKVEALFKPTEALQKSEKLIVQAESAIQALEKKAKQESKGKGKSTGKETAKPKAQPTNVGAKAIKTEQPSGKVDAQEAEDRTR